MKKLYKRNFLKISDFNKSEITKIIQFARILKKNKEKKKEVRYLKNKKIALIFEQESTRTRCAFEIAAFEQGAYTSYFAPNNLHLGYKESAHDTIKVMEKIYDGIAYRGIKHNNLKILSENSNIPIWNGLTEKYHPTQLLADILTMQECTPQKKISEIICTYVGDASNNIANTILELASILGFNLRLVAPKLYWPNKNTLNKYQIKYNKKILCTEDIEQGVKNTDFIYTDVWLSMGTNQKELEKRIKILRKYQVNYQMLELTKNLNIKVLHCLPALHDINTILGKNISEKYNMQNGIEITNDVFQDNKNIIFTQSNNKLHTIKSLMILTLKKNVNIPI
ncbi:ornithine carbamoyltransferase [Buchnera aphidicola]|uniref:ornithine carbamoyltransferase n=1 Tax=Buchnera aphidicola TaxID=9 RepID=UPI0031B8AEE8